MRPERDLSGPLFDPETYLAAKRAWDVGGFDPAVWREVRAISWERGYPYPPAGDPYDDPDDGIPSQRAIVYRALDYRPIETIAFARSSRSWFEVVEKIIGSEARLREGITYREELASEEARERASHRESVVVLKRIIERIGDS